MSLRRAPWVVSLADISASVRTSAQENNLNRYKEDSQNEYKEDNYDNKDNLGYRIEKQKPDVQRNKARRLRWRLRRCHQITISWYAERCSLCWAVAKVSVSGAGPYWSGKIIMRFLPL